MILKASQRGGGSQLARHLLRDDENDHVRVHEIRGFVSSDLHGAFKEAHAISRGTKCRQFLFSLSLSPPETAKVPAEIFEKAIAAIEEKVGLTGQPRAIVFHEKEGRRHAHCVWSRIDATRMKAINLPHFKMKLQDVSRDIYLERGWQMPRGLMNTAERNPLNFTLIEWQQAKRISRDPRAIKQVFQDCWAVSDSIKGFANALNERGYILAKGDRRGFVAVDWRGEVYAIPRWVGVRTKEVAARFGASGELPTVEVARSEVSERFVGKLGELLTEAEEKNRKAIGEFESKRKTLVDDQRLTRETLVAKQNERWQIESRERSSRLPTGLKALWFRLTGQYRALKKQNEHEASVCALRDKHETDDLSAVQLRDRQSLQHEKHMLRHRQNVLDKRINHELLWYRGLVDVETKSRRSRRSHRETSDRKPRRAR